MFRNVQEWDLASKKNNAVSVLKVCFKKEQICKDDIMRPIFLNLNQLFNRLKIFVYTIQCSDVHNAYFFNVYLFSIISLFYTYCALFLLFYIKFYHVNKRPVKV